jgi:PTS system galactitol-specific IIA component
MTGALYRPELCWASFAARDAGEAIHQMATALLGLGLVRPTFAAAVLEREAVSPTGLPLARRKIALPHADPEHVVAPAVAVCTLARPVVFCEMGNPASELEVDAILMLALPDRESAQQELVRLVEACQDPDFVDRLYAAPDAQSLYLLVSGGEAR